jgi:hypothetical protein
MTVAVAKMSRPGRRVVAVAKMSRPGRRVVAVAKMSRPGRRARHRRGAASFATDMNLANADFFEIRRDVAKDGVLRKR